MPKSISKKNIFAKKNSLKSMLSKTLFKNFSKIFLPKMSKKKYCAKNHSLFTNTEPCQPSFGFPWPWQHPLRPLSQVSLQALRHQLEQLLTYVDTVAIAIRMEIYLSIVKAVGSQGAQLRQYKLRSFSDCLIEIGYNLQQGTSLKD